jgi:ABC-type lipoprotein export system ATPase subunit
MAPLIQLRHVTKTFGTGEAQFQALRGVDLEIAAGDFVAIMGPSGSGKSTMMNILGCLDVPSSGDVLVDGKSVLGGQLPRDSQTRSLCAIRCGRPRRSAGQRRTFSGARHGRNGL